ncbi:MAG: pilus assembly protein TadG-related protein [Neomegalonema sp.]|nr:pilus assembly protein TadG-related protein [Neomegalonema sp.]MDD2867067.1 pilus assembly protein TadG-related protein [Neomegalonema sp.]
MRLVSLFSRSRRGAVAPMMGVCLFLLVLVSGGAVEYSNFHRARDTLQKTADAAALSAARHFHENRDEAAARTLVERILAAGETSGYATQLPFDFKVEYNEEHHSSHAAMRVRAKAATSFMRLAGIESLTAEVESFATKGGVKDIYVYLLLDVTGSMQGLINVASTAMVDFEAQLRTRLEQQGVEMGRLFVKTGYFRDLRSDMDPPAWEESPVYDMSDPAQRLLMRDHIRARRATGGGDTPESSTAAIAYALTSPLELPVGGAPLSRHMIQVIGVWTHVEGLPLGPEDLSAYRAANGSAMRPQVDDLTVPLYQTLRQNGELAALQRSMSATPGVRVEDAHYNSSYYGCCKSMEQLRTEWLSRGAVGLSNRYLALFVYQNQYPWREMTRWENVIGMDYVDSSADAFIDGVVRAVIESGVSLQIEPPPSGASPWADSSRGSSDMSTGSIDPGPAEAASPPGGASSSGGASSGSSSGSSSSGWSSTSSGSWTWSSGGWSSGGSSSSGHWGGSGGR